MPNGTNASKLSLWIIGLIFPVAAASVAATLANIRANTADIAVLKSQAQETRERLQSIEHKVDRLIERR